MGRPKGEIKSREEMLRIKKGYYEKYKNKYKEYYSINKEKIKNRVSKYRENNKEAISKKERERRLSNPDRFRLYNKNYANKNKDKLAIKAKKWREDNKLKMKLSRKEWYIKNFQTISEKNRIKYLINKVEINKKRKTIYAEKKDVLNEVRRVQRKENPHKLNDLKRIWVQKNKSKVFARQKKWRKDNREKARETARISANIRYHRNPKKFIEAAKKHRDKYPERHQKRLKEYRKNNPEVIRAIETRKRVAGKVSAGDLKSLMAKQNGLCFYCHIDISNKYHIDHYLPITLGGLSDIENIVLSCPKCNLTKNAKHPDVFMAEIKKVVCLR